MALVVLVIIVVLTGIFLYHQHSVNEKKINVALINSYNLKGLKYCKEGLAALSSEQVDPNNYSNTIKLLQYRDMCYSMLGNYSLAISSEKQLAYYYTITRQYSKAYTADSEVYENENNLTHPVHPSSALVNYQKSVIQNQFIGNYKP